MSTEPNKVDTLTKTMIKEALIEQSALAFPAKHVSKYRKGTHPSTAHRRLKKGRNAAKGANAARKKNR